MLGNVFAKTIRDRWSGWLIAVISLAALLWVSMAAYRSVDLSVYTSLPAVYRALLNIPARADVASLAISALITTYGSITMASMALSMGGASIAGEESAGTMGLLLANPKSRVSILLQKAAALVVLSALGVAALWGSILLISSGLSVSIQGMHPGALMVHLFAATLFYGFLALAIGAATGNRGAAVWTAVSVLVVGFVATGLLPLFKWGKSWVKIFPWYYFNGSNPLIHGIDWWHVAVLAGLSVLLCAVGIAGVARRDLKTKSVGSTLLDQLRANPTVDKYLGKILSVTQVSSIWVKTAAEYQGLMIIAAYYMFLVQGLVIGLLYAALPKAALHAIAQLPAALIALVGGGDISTPQGFYQLETFGMMAPVIVMLVTISIGTGAVSGEESRRTMGLLLANPVSRTRVIAEKVFTMVVYAFVVGLITFGGVALGSKLGKLHISTWNIAAACLLATLAGLTFGALALALGAGTGRSKVAVYGSVGAGIALHVINGLSMISDKFVPWAKISPFHYYLGNDPLNNGMDWGHAAVLVAISVVFVLASFVLFQRRDIRTRG